MADSVYELMMALRHNPDFRSAFRIQNAQEWLAFYRRHRHLERSVLRDHWSNCGATFSSKNLMGAFETYGDTGRLPPIDLPPERLAAEWGSFMQELSDQIWGSLEDHVVDQEKKSYEERLEECRRLSSPETLFLLRVSLPCWLEYGVSPGLLLRTARHGDINAIDHILRLDELTLQDPRIVLHISEARRNPAKGRFKRIHAAIGDFPARKLTPKNTKECMAALISVLCENVGFSVTGPDIRRLYDAIAQDLKDSRIDVDFAGEEPDSFSRAIRRHRSFWEPLAESGWPMPPNLTPTR